MRLFAAEPRWAVPPSPGRENFGRQVDAVARALGFGGLMPWQALHIGTATEEIGGVPAFRQVTVEVPRQQGKSVGILSLMLARAVDVPGTMISYSAQTRISGRRRLLDVWWPRIRRSPLRKMIRPRRQLGMEAYEFFNGSLLMLASGTETSDHGDTLDLAVIDEAWAHRDDTIEQAVKPAMMTRQNAQLWVVSTAGNENSAYFRGKVEDGRAMAELGATDTSAYFGYSAPDDADPGAEETWWRCMPALGHTVMPETVRSDFATMDLAEFRRAYLCQWPEVAKPGWGPISQEQWMSCVDPRLRQ